MAPKRKATDLKLKSIWDETLVKEVMDNGKHRAKMWNWLLFHPDKDICDIPFDTWRVKRESSAAILRDFVRFTTKIVEKNVSARGDSTKLLVELQDGHRVETVVMIHVSHATVCVSSQIGCQMGCRFCATGTMGIIGNLTSAEILEQLVYANQVTRIRNVVFMGMGEPLNNYDNVKLAIEAMIDCNRFGLSSKHVTVSTVGVLKSMERMSTEMPYVNLALSLHAPNQEVRLKIVPAASAHHIDKLMAAVDAHIAANRQAFISRKVNHHGVAPSDEKVDELIRRSVAGKRLNKTSGVMIEYILIKEVNDQACHAKELAQLLLPRRDHIILNLIPYNPTEVAEDYEAPTEESVKQFHEICMSPPYEINTRVRQEKGQDIAGACGQLALVNPGIAGAPRDIEDSVSRKYQSKLRDAALGREGKLKGKAVGAGKNGDVGGCGTGSKAGTCGTGSASAAQGGDCECEKSECICDYEPVAVSAEKAASAKAVVNKQTRSRYLCYANVLVPAVLFAAAGWVNKF